MSGAPAPRRDDRIACICGFTLGWFVRVQTEQAMVRNPTVRLLLFTGDRRWELRCPKCGASWLGPRSGEAVLVT